MSSVAYRLRVQGRVQGVWYRASAKKEAQRLGLLGWARNESDGSVQIEVQGQEKAVEAFIAWCAEGPMMARVDRVDREAIPPGAYSEFAIRR